MEIYMHVYKCMYPCPANMYVMDREVAQTKRARDKGSVWREGERQSKETETHRIAARLVFERDAALAAERALQGQG